MSEKVPEQFRKLEIYPGYACTRNCRFCFVSKEDKKKYSAHIPFKKMCETVYKAYLQGTRFLSVLGGEPTLYPKLPELLDFAKKLGYKSTSLFSNGFRMAEEGYVEKLAMLNVDTVHLNFPSHKPDVFDYITQSEGGFQRACQALDNLVRAGITVVSVCVLTKQNCASLKDYAAYLSSRGASVFMLHYTKLQGNMDYALEENRKNIMDIAVPMKAAASGIMEMTDYCVSKRIMPPFVEIMPPCLLGRYASRLIDFRQEHNIDNSETIMQPGLDMDDTWEWSYDGRIKLPGCRRCLWQNRCYGIEKNYAELFGISEFLPITEDPGNYYDGIDKELLPQHLAALPEAVAAARIRSRKTVK